MTERAMPCTIFDTTTVVRLVKAKKNHHNPETVPERLIRPRTHLQESSRPVCPLSESFTSKASPAIESVAKIGPISPTMLTRSQEQNPRPFGD